MDFSRDKNLNFDQAKKILFNVLGEWKIMALASSVNDHVMVRNVSCIFYENRVFFKTDINFRKTQQIIKNPNVALCFNGVQIEGMAENKGLVIEEKSGAFKKKYNKFLKESYNKYSHEDTEILIEVHPKYVEIWDTSENGYAYQIFLDFQKEEVIVKPYDVKQ